MGYMEGGMFSKIVLIVFLLLVVGVTTFYQSNLLNKEKMPEETENQTLPGPENQTIEQNSGQNLTGSEEESQGLGENASQEKKEESEKESCALMEDLPDDIISLQRRIANLTEENRLLNRTIENQKEYIQSYKRAKEGAERNLKECLNTKTS